ncbi:MAG TPA: DNA repair protein RadC [Methanocorpusculum sp.]|nr:DNA repair protein RadC [Methanocorpusculum sp.]
MNLKETADIDKPREKLMNRGPASLELHELVAAIIGRGTVGCDAMQMGKQIGSILMEKTYETTTKDLCRINGMGAAKACQIVASLELARRFPPPKIRRALITRPSDVLPFVAQYRFEKQENLIVISLTGAHEVINIRLITRGILDNCQVHPREIFADAIADRAAAIIIVHNHPSGRLEPSKLDISMTQVMKRCGQLLGIPLLDHIIIGPEDGYVSIPDE